MKRPTGWVIWLTGLPASGKTALAWALRRKLNALGIPAMLLDSDELRRILLPNASYTPAERDWLYHRLVELAAWLAREGEHVIIAATGSQRSYREAARAVLGPRFAEVWVRCPIEICRARDPKGLYRRAEAGEIHNLPGVDAPYEAPDRPEAVVDTGRQTADEAAQTVLAHLPFAHSTATRSCRKRRSRPALPA